MNKLESLTRKIGKLQYEVNYQKELVTQYKEKYEKEAAKSADQAIKLHVQVQEIADANKEIEKANKEVQFKKAVLNTIEAKNHKSQQEIDDLKTTIKTLNSLYHGK